MENNKKVMGMVANHILKLEYKGNQEIFTHKIVSEMLKDIHVSTATSKVDRGVTSREYSFSDKSNESNDDLEKLKYYFNDELEWNKYFKKILQAAYYGFGCLEIVWDEEYKIKDLVFIPQNFLRYENGDNSWYFSGSGDTLKLDNELKFSQFNYNGGIENPHGISELIPVFDTYMDKKNIRGLIRDISNKYGGVITVYLYDASWDLTEEGRELKRATGESLKDVGNGTSLGIPTNLTENVSMKDIVHFINLNELDTVIHERLEERYKKDIYYNILGADFSTGKGGSYSRDQVQSTELYKIINERSIFLADVIKKSILKPISLIHELDISNIELNFSDAVTGDQKEDLEAKKHDNVKKKIDNYSLLKNQHGLEIKKEKLINELGFKKSIFNF